jgi:hypothetical protein
MYAEVSFRGLFVAFFGGREEKKKKKKIPKGNRHKVRHSNLYGGGSTLALRHLRGFLFFCVWVCWFPGARHFAPRPHPLLFGLDIGV